MTNITANGLGNDGIHIGSANVSATQNIQANDNGRHGVYTGGDDANATTFINIDVSNNYTDGWHNAASYNAVVIGGYGHNNGRNAFYQGDNRGMLFGVGGESNVDSAVHVAGRRNFELSPIDHYAGEHHGPVPFSVIDPVSSFNPRSMLQCT